MFLLSCQYNVLSCWLSRQHPFVLLSGRGDLMYDYLDCGSAGSVSEPDELLALGNVPEPDAGRAKRRKSPCGPDLGTTFS